MQDKAANLLSLFASSSTLICCALPALFVAIGAGASFASLISLFPFLVVLSEYKLLISLFALITITVAGYINYKTARLPCPSDSETGKLCLKTRQRSRKLYYGAVCLFLLSSIFTYAVPAFL